MEHEEASLRARCGIVNDGRGSDESGKSLVTSRLSQGAMRTIQLTVHGIHLPMIE